MVVLVNVRLVLVQHEQVAVPAIAETRCRLRTQLLLDACKPSFGAFPRVVSPVELVGSIRPIAGRQQNIGRSRFPLEPALVGERIAAVVAVGDKAIRCVPAAGELIREGPGRVGGAQMLFQRTVVARARPQHPTQPLVGLACQKVHRAAQGVRTVKGRTRPMQNIDPCHRVQRNRNVEIQVSRLRIIHTQPIYQNQGLLEGRPAQREIRLHALRRTRLNIH